MIIEPNDIERVESYYIYNNGEKETHFNAINLPYDLTAYYSNNGHLTVYSINTEVYSGTFQSKREAECFILGVIEGWGHIISLLHDEGLRL